MNKILGFSPHIHLCWILNFFLLYVMKINSFFCVIIRLIRQYKYAMRYTVRLIEDTFFSIHRNFKFWSHKCFSLCVIYKLNLLKMRSALGTRNAHRHHLSLIFGLRSDIQYWKSAVYDTYTINNKNEMISRALWASSGTQLIICLFINAE